MLNGATVILYEGVWIARIFNTYGHKMCMTTGVWLVTLLLRCIDTAIGILRKVSAGEEDCLYRRIQWLWWFCSMEFLTCATSMFGNFGSWKPSLAGIKNHHNFRQPFLSSTLSSEVTRTTGFRPSLNPRTELKIEATQEESRKRSIVSRLESL